MKLIKSFENTFTENKELFEVDYFGLQLGVPEGYNYIATDTDGFVYGYQNKPLFNDENQTWATNPKDNDILHLARVELSKKPKQTLKGIKDILVPSTDGGHTPVVGE